MSVIFTNFAMHKLMGEVTCHERHLLSSRLLCHTTLHYELSIVFPL
jgi:hypothetical protein